MTESGTDLRTFSSRESNENAFEIERGLKRKLETSQDNQADLEELQRTEKPSAPKRRRRSKEGAIGKAKKSISSLLQRFSTFLFGYSDEENENLSDQMNMGDRHLGQDQAVDMTQQGYNRQYLNARMNNKENSHGDPVDIEIVEENASTSMTFKADIHHRSDGTSRNNEKRGNPKLSSSFQNPNEFSRPTMGFGVQASGPLSTKTAMANIKFKGRQFAVSTQEKRDVERKNNRPSFILNQIRQKNISAATNDSPYRPLGVVDKILREDISLGVRRSKAGGAIMHHKPTNLKRNAFIEASRREDYMKYKAILENSPGTGLIKGAFRGSRLGLSNKSVIQNPWNDANACNRTSLFESPITSSAVSRTRFNRQITAEHTQKISNQMAPRIPVVNLEDDDENAKKHSKSFTTTIFTPKALGANSDIPDILEKYSPQVVNQKDATFSADYKITNKSSSPNSLEADLLLEKVYKEDFLQELLDKYGTRSKRIDRSISKETVKAEYHKEKLVEVEKTIEDRIRSHLKLTEIELASSDDDTETKQFDEVRLPEMTDDMDMVADSALQSRDGVLVNAYSISITGNDLCTLIGLDWLNDEVINFYMQMIVERASTNTFGWPKVYATNTFFYPKLMQSGHAALKRWTRKIDIFSYDLIIVPVHLGMHWCLATIDLKQKGVFYYDSMSGDNMACLNALIKYLQDEHIDKKKATFDTSDFQSVIVKDIPQQMNGSDCGMFACKFAEYLSRNAAITFTQEDMPYFRRRMIYEIVKNNLMYP